MPASIIIYPTLHLPQFFVGLDPAFIPIRCGNAKNPPAVPHCHSWLKVSKYYEAQILSLRGKINIFLIKNKKKNDNSIIFRGTEKTLKSSRITYKIYHKANIQGIKTKRLFQEVPSSITIYSAYSYISENYMKAVPTPTQSLL